MGGVSAPHDGERFPSAGEMATLQVQERPGLDFRLDHEVRQMPPGQPVKDQLLFHRHVRDRALGRALDQEMAFVTPLSCGVADHALGKGAQCIRPDLVRHRERQKARRCDGDELNPSQFDLLKIVS